MEFEVLDAGIGQTSIGEAEFYQTGIGLARNTLIEIEETLQLCGGLRWNYKGKEELDET